MTPSNLELVPLASASGSGGGRLPVPLPSCGPVVVGRGRDGIRFQYVSSKQLELEHEADGVFKIRNTGRGRVRLWRAFDAGSSAEGQVGAGGLLGPGEESTMRVGDAVDLIIVAMLPAQVKERDPQRYVLRKKQEGEGGGSSALVVGKRRTSDALASSDSAAWASSGGDTDSQPPTTAKRRRTASQISHARDDEDWSQTASQTSEGGELDARGAPLGRRISLQVGSAKEGAASQDAGAVQSQTSQGPEGEVGMVTDGRVVRGFSVDQLRRWAGRMCTAFGLGSEAVAAMQASVEDNEVDGEVLAILEGDELSSALALPRCTISSGMDATALVGAIAGRRLQVCAMSNAPLDTTTTDDMCSWAEGMLEGEGDLATGVCEMMRTHKMDGAVLMALRPDEAGLCLAPKGDEEMASKLARMWSDARSVLTVNPAGKLYDPRRALVSIVVIGNTGAGKSTLLNALLEEESLLPTNAMRACTAAIIEMVYSGDLAADNRYSAQIDFLSLEDWAGEVRECFAVAGEDAMEEDGEQGDEVRKQHRAKIESAYGKGIDWSAGAEALLQRPGAISDSLGKSIALRASSGKALRDAYERYADSSNSAAEGSMWPIVKRIVLRGPWEVLSAGVRLVDAPGLRDDNSARDAVVEGYLKGADCVWLVSAVKRAVNDKTTMDLLSSGYRQQVRDEGVEGSLAYIATQTDDILRTEIIGNLDLPEDAGPLDCALARNDFFCTTIKKRFDQGLPEVAAGGKGKGGCETFAVSAVDYQRIRRVRKNDGSAGFFTEEATQMPALKEHIRSSAEKVRASGFKSGAALFAHMQEAKRLAQQEEDEANRMPVDGEGSESGCREMIEQLRKAVADVKQGGGALAISSLILLPQSNAIFSLSVDGIGRIGLPLCNEQAEKLKRLPSWSSETGALAGSIVMAPLGTLCLPEVQNFCSLQGVPVPDKLDTRVSKLLLVEAGRRSPVVISASETSDTAEVFLRVLVQIPSEYSSVSPIVSAKAFGGGSYQPKDLEKASGDSFYTVTLYAHCSIEVSPPAEGRALYALVNVCDPSKSAPQPRPVDSFGVARQLSHSLAAILSNQSSPMVGILVTDLGKQAGDSLLARLEPRAKALCGLLDSSLFDFGLATVCFEESGSVEERTCNCRKDRSSRYGWRYSYDSDSCGDSCGEECGSDRDLDEVEERKVSWIGPLLMADGTRLAFEPHFRFVNEDESHEDVRCEEIIDMSGNVANLFDGGPDDSEISRREGTGTRTWNRSVVVVWRREETVPLMLRPGGSQGPAEWRAALALTEQRIAEAAAPRNVEVLAEHAIGMQDRPSRNSSDTERMLRLMSVVGPRCRNAASSFVTSLCKPTSLGIETTGDACALKDLWQALGGWESVRESGLEFAAEMPESGFTGALLRLGDMVREEMGAPELGEALWRRIYADTFKTASLPSDGAVRVLEIVLSGLEGGGGGAIGGGGQVDAKNFVAKLPATVLVDALCKTLSPPSAAAQASACVLEVPLPPSAISPTVRSLSTTIAMAALQSPSRDQLGCAHRLGLWGSILPLAEGDACLMPGVESCLDLAWTAVPPPARSNVSEMRALLVLRLIQSNIELGATESVLKRRLKELGSRQLVRFILDLSAKGPFGADQVKKRFVRLVTTALDIAVELPVDPQTEMLGLWKVVEEVGSDEVTARVLSMAFDKAPQVMDDRILEIYIKAVANPVFESMVMLRVGQSARRLKALIEGYEKRCRNLVASLSGKDVQNLRRLVDLLSVQHIQAMAQLNHLNVVTHLDVVIQAIVRTRSEKAIESLHLWYISLSPVSSRQAMLKTWFTPSHPLPSLVQWNTSPQVMKLAELYLASLDDSVPPRPNVTSMVQASAHVPRMGGFTAQASQVERFLRGPDKSMDLRGFTGGAQEVRRFIANCLGFSHQQQGNFSVSTSTIGSGKQTRVLITKTTFPHVQRAIAAHDQHVKEQARMRALVTKIKGSIASQSSKPNVPRPAAPALPSFSASSSATMPPIFGSQSRLGSGNSTNSSHRPQPPSIEPDYIPLAPGAPPTFKEGYKYQESGPCGVGYYRIPVVCGFCSAPSPAMLCPCHKANYCGKACQGKAWLHSHKLVCGAPKTPNGAPPDLLSANRVAGGASGAVKAGDGRSSSSSLGGQGQGGGSSGAGGGGRGVVIDLTDD